MTYTKTLTAEQLAIMTAKAGTEAGIPALFDAILDRYIADCARDVQMDFDVKVRELWARIPVEAQQVLVAQVEPLYPPITEAT